MSCSAFARASVGADRHSPIGRIETLPPRNSKSMRLSAWVFEKLDAVHIYPVDSVLGRLVPQLVREVGCCYARWQSRWAMYPKTLLRIRLFFVLAVLLTF